MMLVRTVEPGQATGAVAKVYAAFDRAGAVPLPMQLLSASPGLQDRQFALLNYYLSHPSSASRSSRPSATWRHASPVTTPASPSIAACSSGRA